jgi:hypothetical protein
MHGLIVQSSGNFQAVAYLITANGCIGFGARLTSRFPIKEPLVFQFLLDCFGQFVAPGAYREDGQRESKKESLHGETVVFSNAVAVLTHVTEFGFISESEFCFSVPAGVRRSYSSSSSSFRLRQRPFGACLACEADVFGGWRHRPSATADRTSASSVEPPCSNLAARGGCWSVGTLLCVRIAHRGCGFGSLFS